jgi:hypothetical protein
MKKNKKLILIALSCFIAFAAVSQTIQESLSRQLIGEWRDTYVKIIVHHEGKAPVTMEADSSNWLARLHIKPIRTYFKGDGSYYSIYLNAKDSVVRKTTGLWSIKSDSITMDQRTPDKSVYRLHVSINKDVASFSGVIDFEGDGKADDEYSGRQGRFK